MSRLILKPLILMLVACPFRHADALEPCSQFLEKYAQVVERAAGTAQNNPNSTTVTTLPAFRPESALKIANDTVSLIEFNSSIWYEGLAHDGVSPKLGLKTSTARLPPSLATRLTQTIAKHIGRSKPSGRPGLDGVFYRFTTPEGGCAQTWSPEADSDDGKLVQVLNLLEAHARSGGAPSPTRERAIFALLDSL